MQGSKRLELIQYSSTIAFQITWRYDIIQNQVTPNGWVEFMPMLLLILEAKCTAFSVCVSSSATAMFFCFKIWGDHLLSRYMYGGEAANFYLCTIKVHVYILLNFNATNNLIPQQHQVFMLATHQPQVLLATQNADLPTIFPLMLGQDQDIQTQQAWKMYGMLGSTLAIDTKNEFSVFLFPQMFWVINICSTTLVPFWLVYFFL